MGHGTDVSMGELAAEEEEANTPDKVVVLENFPFSVDLALVTALA